MILSSTFEEVNKLYHLELPACKNDLYSFSISWFQANFGQDLINLSLLHDSDRSTYVSSFFCN